MISVNVQYFREAALFYEKHGRYDDGIWDSYHYHDYWDRERDRCINGMKVGDLWITGHHYSYLNYSEIMIVREVKEQLYGEVFKNKKAGIRKPGFPDFWDVDLQFFHEFDLAQKHGEHFGWIKPRGVGASWKAASMSKDNFFLYPRSKTYHVAHDSTHLLGDGLYSKFLTLRNFMNKPHPDEDRYMNAFGKPSDYKADVGDMWYRASSKINGIEQGYMSEVIGITTNNNLDKARGLRGKLICLEEAGANPNVEKTLSILRSSVEEQDVVYGTIFFLGTGGTVASKFGEMEKLIYNPQAYNIRCFDNIHDEGMRGTKCCYFTPAYKAIQFKDKNGNSNEKQAKAHYDAGRELAAKSSDSNAIIQYKSENPYTIQEAILRNSHSPLPSNEANEWYHKVIGQGLHNIGVNGVMENIDGKIVFAPKSDAVPILKYPHDTSDNLTGCVVQYYAPIKRNGKIPDNLYIIAHDPYAFDQSTDSQSLGAAYVYMQPNNISKPGDRIVATYFGRPKTMDEYNRQLFMLAEYYNAKIGFENDRGDVIGYAKRFKKLDWLSEEFELAFDADLPKSKVKRQFGMHIGSGKENLRVHKGNKYLYDWLITPRGMDEEGRSRMNLHTIYCPATLKEIQLYRSDGGNFDRISALRILAYYQKELVYKEQTVQEVIPDISGNSFFNKRHF